MSVKKHREKSRESIYRRLNVNATLYCSSSSNFALLRLSGSVLGAKCPDLVIADVSRAHKRSPEKSIETRIHFGCVARPRIYLKPNVMLAVVELEVRERVENVPQVSATLPNST